MFYGIETLVLVLVIVLSSLGFRKPIFSLLLGALVSTAFSILLRPDTFSSVMSTAATHVLFNKNHLALLAFAIMMGCIGGILHHSSAMRALFDAIRASVSSRRSAQVMSVVPSLFLWFDELGAHAHTGRHMRDVFDHHKISRQKLAYLTGASSVAMTSITITSLYTAFLVSIIYDAKITLPGHIDAFRIFIATIPFNFYAIFSLMMVVSVAITKRDFGPMLTHEKDALKICSKPLRSRARLRRRNTRLALFFGTIITLSWGTLILIVAGAWNSGDIYMALPLGGSFAFFFAIIFSLTNKLLQPSSLRRALSFGIKNVVDFLLILVAAWVLSFAITNSGSLIFIRTVLAHIDGMLLPTLMFAVAAGASLAMGWCGALALIVPLVMPPTMQLHDGTLVCATLASIVGGASFGSHCSPHSDFSLWASLASRCDIDSHVSSQSHYAMLTALFTIIFGTLPVAFGFQLNVTLVGAYLLIIASLMVFGARTQAHAPIRFNS